MSDDGEVLIQENNIKITVAKNHANPGKCETFYNPVMKICREFVLATLATYCSDLNSPVKCLDAFGATGIGGLQWKHHLRDSVDVTINELDVKSVQAIKDNCLRNDIGSTKPNNDVEGPKSANGPSDTATTSNQPEEQMTMDSTMQPVSDKVSTAMPSVEVVHGDANVIMHQRSFHFIHLDPYGTTVQFLDAALRNIYNKGILVLTSTDLASLYGKCPQVTLRNYGAHTATTDYVKEIAVRLIIAQAVRSAARCNKGVQVLYSLAIEHYVQVALLIKRGATHADVCRQHIHSVLHCQCCGEWAVYPNSRTVMDNVYSYLPCDCHEANSSSKVALRLGPMWCCQIYQTDFLQKMFTTATQRNLSTRLCLLVSQLICESDCPYASYSQHTPTEGTECNGVKRPAWGDDVGGGKRVRGLRQCGAEEMPMFYYNVHRRKVKGIDLPKVTKLVKLLQEQQFRASRTHFDTNSVRTNATLAQLLQLLHTQCKTSGRRNSTREDTIMQSDK